MPLRSFNREQAWLLPPTLGELIPEDLAVQAVDGTKIAANAAG